MTELQIRVLIECARDVQSIEALAKTLNVSRSAASRALAALETKGYIRGPGAKARWFRATPTGINSLLTLDRQLNDAIDAYND